MSLFRKVRTFDSLSNRDYRLMLLSQISIGMGLSMDAVSRSWLIYQITGSPFQLGLVNAARGVPFLVFGLFAGVIADRYGRKGLILLAQSIVAASHLTVFTLVLTHNILPWHLYVSAFVTGSAHAMQQPARQALAADLVGDRQILNAVSLNSATVNVSKSIGPSIAGLLIQGFGPGFGFLAQGCLYLFASTSIIRIKAPRPETLPRDSALGDSKHPVSLFGGIHEGIKYVVSQKLIVGLLILGLTPALLAAPFVSLMPVFAIDVFRGNARTQGLILTTLGVGSVMGALMAASWRKQSSGKVMLFCAAMLGLSLVLFAYSPLLSMAMFFVFLYGVFDTTYGTQNITALQLLSPRELRGRVLGMRMLDKGLEPLGSVVYGGLAVLLGARNAVALMGGLCVLVVLVIGMAVPSIRRLGQKDSKTFSSNHR